jgi:trk system potassium uptake protein TrkH
VELLSRSNLFWRSFTHWIGGMGVLVLMVAVLPLSGSHNIHLMKAESPGPSVGKLVPRIRQTARILYGIYLGMTAVLIILLFISGLNVFDSLAIGFGTAATGGCFILQSGITTYPVFSQIVITVFMLLFSINFNVYHLLLARKPKEALKHQETRYYFLAIIVATALIVWNSRQFFSSLPMAIHTAAFQVVSMISSTGYAAANFTLWPMFSQTILLALMFVGACSGSTGGGIKVARVTILLKLIKNEVSYLVHPKRVRQVRMEGHVISKEVWRGIQVFLLSYLMIFALSLLVLSLDELDFTTNFTTVLACLNNVGLGMGRIGPDGDFRIFSKLSEFVLMFDMLAGRLEIFPLLVCLAPSTWKRN